MMIILQEIIVIVFILILISSNIANFGGMSRTSSLLKHWIKIRLTTTTVDSIVGHSFQETN